VQFPIPDPAYTASRQAQARFRLALRVALGFTALIWLIDTLQWAVDQEPDPFGIRLLGRDSIHIGASGLVYGLVTYVLVAGLLRRDRRAIAASLAVYFMYGTLVLGLGPTTAGVSWETHLAAASIGVALAVALRRLDVPPRKRYDWEEEAHPDVDNHPGTPNDGQDAGRSLQ
jgi:membrane associated rhomboid family serine protease